MLIVHVICPPSQCPAEVAELQTGSLQGFLSSMASPKHFLFFCYNEEKCPPENSFSVTQEAIEVSYSQHWCQKETGEETKEEDWVTSVWTFRRRRPKKQDYIWGNISDHWLQQSWWHRWYICVCRFVTLLNYAHQRKQMSVPSKAELSVLHNPLF